MTAASTIVLEPAAQQVADAFSKPPFLYDMSPADARKVLEDAQSAPVSIEPRGGLHTICTRSTSVLHPRELRCCDGQGPRGNPWPWWHGPAAAHPVCNAADPPASATSATMTCWELCRAAADRRHSSSAVSFRRAPKP